jgi:hypothetical protein
VILSASRATDVPALYGEWLLRRLRAGWCGWVNRRNGRLQRVSFARARAIVFWTKNPAPLLPRLAEIDDLGFDHATNFTLNDYEAEGLEPGIPPLAERVETFRRLSAIVGPARVAWRFDPILVGGALTPEAVLERIARVGDLLHRHTRRLVISFADVACYPAARARLRAHAGGFGEPDAAAVETIAAGIARLNRAWGLDLSACAEPYDLSRFGIRPGRCVDDALLARAFPGGAGLPKDPGQRPLCGCAVSKDIGRYGTCTHGCVYCYATASHAAAASAHAHHDPNAEHL